MAGLIHNLTNRIEKLQGSAARLTMRIPPFGQRALAKVLGFDQQFSNLDPHLQLLVAARNLMGHGQLISPNIKQSRHQFSQEMRSILERTTPVASVNQWNISTDSANIPVRHYLPKITAQTQNINDQLPLLVFCHGGGFVVGDLDTHDEACRLLCQYGQLQVLSVAYRLAPEHKAPAAVEDCLAVLKWAHEHATELNVDPRKIAIGGDSAGGNISAVVSQLAAGQPYAPAVQLLLYPGVDFVTQYPSHIMYGHSLFISQNDIDNAKSLYSDNSGILRSDPQLSPLYGNLTGLAATLLITAEFDVLRDEGELYAVKLREAGTRCEAYRVEGQGHGFINITSINHGALKTTQKIAQDLRTLLDQQVTA